LIYLVKYQCSPQCSENETCQYYQCICNVGFYRNPSGQCGKYNRSELNIIFPDESVRADFGGTWKQEYDIWDPKYRHCTPAS